MTILRSALFHVTQTRTRSIGYKKLKDWFTALASRNIKHTPPYNHVVQIGDPSLRVVSDTVPKEYINSSEIKFLIKVMKNVFNKYKCVGLSASQVGVPLRIIMFEYNQQHAKCFTDQEQKNREMTLHPFRVIINPETKVSDYTKVVHTELCESVRGLSAEVPRYRTLNLKGFDENAQSVDMELSGWIARIVQHEIDHLNGILYTDIMEKKSLTCTCWNIVNEKGGRVALPYGLSYVVKYQIYS